jgi:hypothetical protein
LDNQTADSLVWDSSPVEGAGPAARPIVTPGFLRYVGELLFGPRWQTPLAQCLGDIRGKALSPATIHQWSTLTRSIPGWVSNALVIALENGQRDFDRRAALAGVVARRLSEASAASEAEHGSQTGAGRARDELVSAQTGR